MRIIHFTGLLFFITILIGCKKFDIERATMLHTDAITQSGNVVEANADFIDIEPGGIIEHGFCYDTKPSPNITTSHINLGARNAPGSYSTILKQLQANKIYYIRAYAKSANSIYYGDEKVFNTNPNNLQLTFDSIIIVNSTSVYFKGSISNIGSLQIKEFGHCWSLTTNPTINSIKSTYLQTNTDTVFKSIYLNPTLNNTYFVKSYAKLDDTTVIYSTQKTFFVPDINITTDSIHIIGSGNCGLYGRFINIGVNPIIEYGFCSSDLTPIPSVNDNKFVVTASPKVGSFYYSNTFITGRKYYIRAYATDGDIIKYGSTITVQL